MASSLPLQQVEPVRWGARKSLFYWFTCKDAVPKFRGPQGHIYIRILHVGS